MASIATTQVGSTGLAVWWIVAASVLFILIVVIGVASQVARIRKRAKAEKPAATPSESAASGTATTALGKLGYQLQCRQQLRVWLDQDTSLRQLVDRSINKQVKSSRRHQQLLALLLALTCLMAGWLLAGLTPSITHLLGR